MHGLIVYLSISCSQRGWTAVLVAAVGGHLELVRELMEQHRADLLHKSNVSSASFCVIVSHICHVYLPSLWPIPLNYTVAHQGHSTVRLVGTFSCQFICPYIEILFELTNTPV